MPSDLHGEAPRNSRWALLYSQGLGVVCALATVLLLAAGSVIIAATRNGAAAQLQMDDILFFFRRPSPWHLWFYLLLPVLALFALNTAWCTWRNLVRLIKLRIRLPEAYAAPVLHVAFLIALLAHGVGGIAGREGQPLLLDHRWRALGGGRQGRLLALHQERLPDGQPKRVQARLAIRDASGRSWETVVGYNQPLSFGWGSDLLLLANYGRQQEAQLTDGTNTCTAVAGAVCALGPHTLRLLAVYPSGHWGPIPAVLVQPSGDGQQHFFLLPDRPQQLADQTIVRLKAVHDRPLVLLRHRHAPGNPWALIAALVLMLGLVLMGRRWIGRGH
jgi:hypothetical protein